MADLEYRSQPIDNIPNGVLLTLAGSIDASTAIAFQSGLDELIASGARNIVVDMDGVKFINSTGLGLLVKIADQTRTNGGDFLLARVYPKVKVVFSMLGLDAFFEMFTNTDQAIAKLVGGGSGGPTTVDQAVQAVSKAPKLPSGSPKVQTRTIHGSASGVSAFVGIPHSLPNFGLIYTKVQAACVGAGIVARRADPNLPDDAWRQALGDVASVNFIIADLTGDPATGQPNPHLLQLADYARTSLNPPKPVLCLLQGPKENLPAPWNARAVIQYSGSPEGLMDLEKRVASAIQKALPRLK